MKIRGMKKMLSVALAGVVGISIVTSPVFAAAGGDGTDIGTGDITINYQSLTKGEDDFTNMVGPNNTIINTDFGYAWDDLNFTYVQTLEGGESTLTTDGGYQKTKNPEFKSGTWYKGAYSTLEELDATDLAVKTLPVISLPAAAMPGADVTAEEFANLPKVIIHNYTKTSATYAFGIKSEDVNKFNANGMITMVNEAREAKEVSETTGTLNGEGTCKFGVSPIGAPATKDFAPFTVGLTITFN